MRPAFSTGRRLRAVAPVTAPGRPISTGRFPISEQGAASRFPLTLPDATNRIESVHGAFTADAAWEVVASFLLPS